jgi:hypothetical protein
MAGAKVALVRPGSACGAGRLEFGLGNALRRLSAAGMGVTCYSMDPSYRASAMTGKPHSARSLGEVEAVGRGIAAGNEFAQRPIYAG